MALLSLLLGLLATLPLAPAQQICNWSQLRNLADTYAESQAAGEVGEPYLTPGLNYTENGLPASISTGLLSRPLEVGYTHSIVDQPGCAVFIELIASSPEKDWLMINTQLRFVNGPEIGYPRAEAVETVFRSATGEAAAARIGYAEAEDWGSISTPDQASREALAGVADVYLDGEGDVDWTAPCARLEGWVYASGAEGGCSGAAGEGRTKFVKKRFVVDVTRAAVSVLSVGKGVAASHEFRIEEGKLRYVHSL